MEQGARFQMRQIDSSTSIRPRRCAIAIAGATGLALGLILDPSALPAADWTIDGTIEEEVQYDDNKRLESSGEQDTFGSILTPEFSIVGRTERTEIEINPRLSLGLFSDDSDFNYFDQFVDVGVSHDLQLGTLGVDWTLSNESTLETEVDDTGNFSNIGRRLGIRSSPFFTYTLSERDSITVRGRFEKVDYRSTDDLDDFTVYGGSVSYDRQVTLRDTVGGQVSYGHFKNDDNKSEKTDAFGASANWSREFSERLSTSLSLGLRYADSQGDDNGDQVGGTFSGSVNWLADERTTLNASISRGLEPSGGGNLVLRDRIGLNLDHKAWETVGFRLGSFYRRNSESTSTGFNNESGQFASINPSVYWDLTRQWELSAGYRFRWDQDDSNDNAYSNTVMLSLTYQTPAWHFND